MNKELFGVFGGRDAFERLARGRTFTRVVEGDRITVGLRDVSASIPTRSGVHEDPDGDGFCAVWGELYPPRGKRADPPRWLYERVADEGRDALDGANGSYLAVFERDGEAFVAGDPIRSWECFYTDAPGARVFGTDAAAVARTVPDPALDPTPFYEFLLLGGVLNDRTMLRGLDRLPLDAALTADGTADLGRYVHRAPPAGFDPVESLARRLRRAVARRSSLPGRKGVLLSGGFDSRVLLAKVPDVAESYTLGGPDHPEVAVARDLADRYGAAHEAVEVGEEYFNLDPEVIQYTNGVKESLHVHHGGYEDRFGVDTMYHGLLWDTLLRGYFLPRDGFDLGGRTLPRRRLDPDPDPVDHLADILGFEPGSERLVAAADAAPGDDRRSFLDATVGAAFDACADRTDGVYDALERFGVQNVLSTPFRTHLADRFVETMVAADADLVRWHLEAPPAARDERTFQAALARVDDDLLRPRPPDRPHRSETLNEVEGFLRKALPGVSPFASPWPDRRELYDDAGLDAVVLPERPDLHRLPPRVKLRVNDARVWLDLATGGAVSPDRLLPRL